jgi:ABC-type transport system involved in multi-copper enzyme maturation permease subunit
MMKNEKRRIVIRFLKAYLSLGAMMAFTVLISIAKGSGWKILPVGMPLFLIFFFGISYQLFKEVRALKRQHTGDSGAH